MVERQMLLTEILLNPSVAEEDELRLSRQNMRIYRRLCNKFLGPPSNVELAEMALKYTSRISDIRAALKPFGLTVAIVKKAEGGLNYYDIVNLNDG